MKKIDEYGLSIPEIKDSLSYQFYLVGREMMKALRFSQALEEVSLMRLEGELSKYGIVKNPFWKNSLTSSEAKYICK